MNPFEKKGFFARQSPDKRDPLRTPRVLGANTVKNIARLPGQAPGASRVNSR
jgi:hypothetical protein